MQGLIHEKSLERWEEKPERLVKAIVQSITSIVITTMSSTRVNQKGFLFVIGFFMRVFGVGLIEGVVRE